MTDDAPKIASTLERTKLFMGASLMCLQVPQIIERTNPFGVLIYLGGLYMILDTVRGLSTQVTASNISQLTWRGRIKMRWGDITSVTRRNRSIVLTAAHGRIVVPTESFYDTRAAVDYLDSHLPAKLRQY
jgi:hypothetical protein